MKCIKSKKLQNILCLTGLFAATSLSGCAEINSSVLKEKGYVLQDTIPGPGLPEDLVAIPGSPWVLISSMSVDHSAQGGLFAINKNTHEMRNLFPDAIKWAADPSYTDCPGRPDMKIAAPHGINVRAGADGVHQVLAINHGGREAVEVFSVTGGDDVPELTWLGCVPLPEKTLSNGVAPTPDGGFVVTKMFDPTSPTGRDDMLAGKLSGYVLHWTADQGWLKVEGSDLAAPNGIEVTPDGKALMVVSWTDKKIHRFPFGGSDVQPASFEVDFMPDNLRWSTDGQLLITGQKSTPLNIVSCAEKKLNCSKGFKVLSIDTEAMTTTELFDSSSADFHDATVALGLGDQIWVGSLSGPRIGYLKK